MQQRLPAIVLAVTLLAFYYSPAGAETATEPSLEDRLLEALPDLPSATLKELLDTGEINRRYATDDSLPQVLLAPAFANEITMDVETIDPTIGVEVLFLVDSPLPANEITLPVFHTMQAMSTMEGIRYYSASRERMRTFFHESYVIDDPDNRERVPDPKTPRVPNRSTIHVFQHDSSFGKNVYELDYEVENEAMLLQMTNLTQMYYKRVLPALGPEQLQMHLVVRPLGDKLLFYGTSAARPGFLFGMEDRVVRSFYNRLVALHDWFVDRMEHG